MGSDKLQGIVRNFMEFMCIHRNSCGFVRAANELQGIAKNPLPFLRIARNCKALQEIGRYS